ncbi:MAG: RluA family pseudouridine synthase [Myxococcota bacterium]
MRSRRHPRRDDRRGPPRGGPHAPGAPRAVRAPAPPRAPLEVVREGRAPGPGGLEILYKDAQICLVDKGPGLLTVPTDRGNPPTVVGLLHHRLRGAHDRLFPVHRLDRDTSGVLVVARTRWALGFLVGQLRSRNLSRVYLGLVRGTPPKAGTLVSHLGTVGKDLRMRALAEGEGKLAVTHFRVVEQAHGVALVAFKLDTGRRNQIRVQMAELGHPLLGEQQYAEPREGDPARQALHSHRLTLPHPDGTRTITGVSPLPEDLASAWRAAGGRHGPMLREEFQIPGAGAPRIELTRKGPPPGARFTEDVDDDEE